MTDFNLRPSLPQPSELEQAHSAELVQFIREIIQAEGGAIPFSRFMELALYAPGLGYYMAGKQQFGRAGDFVTAPELSPLFGYCIALQCAEILEQLRPTQRALSILELGAGRGKLAESILKKLQSLQQLPDYYYILEVSPSLKQEQQAYLQETIPDLMNKIIWLESLPSDAITGIILANEVIDALAVERFYFHQGQLEQYYVSLQDNEFVWELKPAQDELLISCEKLLADLPTQYSSEMNLILPAWINSLSDILKQGSILLFDYGYPRREYYHPERNDGTLLCYYKHHCHSNPLINCGIQDITAHVDFTAVAEAAINAALDVKGFTNQAHFLLNCGINEMVKDPAFDAKSLRQLMLPGEMGEAVKAIALCKNLNTNLLGFRIHNKLHSL